MKSKDQQDIGILVGRMLERSEGTATRSDIQGLKLEIKEMAISRLKFTIPNILALIAIILSAFNLVCKGN